MQTNSKKIYLAKLTPDMSELAGLFAADGSMQKEHLCYWGNPKADKEYYDLHLKTLFQKMFNIEINPHLKKSNGVYGFYICNKGVLDYFHNFFGFPVGSKTYTVEVPKVVLNNNNQVKAAFIRGFFAGDGCINFMRRYGESYKEILKIIHYYPRIQIQSVSSRIILQVSNMLKDLSIKNFVTTRKDKTKTVNIFSVNVYGKERLERWIKKIGFSNPNHSSRYEIFKRIGFVPPNTTYLQRLQILKGQLNPWSFYQKA